MSNDEPQADVPRGTLEEPIRILTDAFEQRECGGCKRPMMVNKAIEGDVLCPVCQNAKESGERIGAEAAAIQARAPMLLQKWLLRAGMSSRELEADLQRIPAPIRQRLSGSRCGWSNACLGRFESGFGLSGGAGIGKTFAIAATMQSAVVARWAARAPLEGNAALKLWLMWVRWPDQVNAMRVRSMQEYGLGEVDTMIERMSKAEALVLDDLGWERLRGDSNSDDWCGSLLDLIVDRRYNNRLPTWYTTNLSLDEFVGRYGPRLVSRLHSDNPLILLPDAPDLRIVRKS